VALVRARCTQFSAMGASSQAPVAFCLALITPLAVRRGPGMASLGSCFSVLEMTVIHFSREVRASNAICEMESKGILEIPYVETGGLDGE